MPTAVLRQAVFISHTFCHTIIEPKNFDKNEYEGIMTLENTRNSSPL